MSRRTSVPSAAEGIELHPGVRLLPLDAEELQRLARRIDPEQTGGISVADLADALFNIAERADHQLRHAAALCRAVLAMLPDEDATDRHPAFRGRGASTPEAAALRELMRNIGAVRELVANGISGACEMLDDDIAQELEQAGVLTDRLVGYRRRGEGGAA